MLKQVFIDKKLDNILRKYDIYHDEPTLNAALQFPRILNAEMDKLGDNAVVAMKGAGEYANFIMALLSDANRNKIKYLISKDETGNLCGLEHIRREDIMDCGIDAVIISSYQYRLEMKIDVLNFSNDILIIDPYEKLEQMGLPATDCLINPYSSYGEIFCNRKLVATVKDKEEQERLCRKLIAEYISIRDFAEAKKCINEYKNRGGQGYQIYIDFLAELDKMFNDIKQDFQQRRKNDVILHWIDALEKKFLDYMPWLGNKCKSESLFFNRAYTTMNFTTEVMKSIFMGKNVVKDKTYMHNEIKSQNSVLLQNLEQHDYDFVYMGEKEVHMDKKYFKYSIPPRVGRTPSSLFYWYSVAELLENEKPVFIFEHCLETHYYCVGGTSSQCIIDPNTYIDFTKNEIEAAQYMDNVLNFYTEIFDAAKVNHIYMSDHGLRADLSEDNTNVIFMVRSPKVRPGTVNELFSLKDISLVVSRLLSEKEDTDISLDGVTSPMIYIDMIDIYNKGFVEARRKIRINEHSYGVHENVSVKEEFKRILPVRKILTSAETYEKNILGEAHYYLGGQREKPDLINCQEYQERIQELDKMLGKFYNPFQEEKFSAALDVYRVLGIKERDVLPQCK